MEGPEDEILGEAVMDDRRPDISPIDLPHSDVVPTEYLWRQCAVFMERLSRNAQLPEGTGDDGVQEHHRPDGG